MSLIHILPEQLANQIAAGEVIERPASVVKECIDNSLDAGATDISIHIEQGGCRSIRVIDNGAGMDEDDLLLCLERHSTSKISPQLTAIQPGAITSLGFRGEAIASIASVSRFTLFSRTCAAPLGAEAHVHFGRLVKVHESGCPQGTIVEVARLFGNLPARKKFLKSAQTEEYHIQEVVVRAGLAHPGVSFHLENENRALVRFQTGEGFEQRCGKILRLAPTVPLLAVSRAEQGRQVTGFLAPPESVAPSQGKIRLFVNKRPIQDRMLLAAVHQGLATFLPPGRRLLAVLHLTVPAEEVDINVHPAKLEVRFRHAAAVRSLVEQAARQALLDYQAALKNRLFTAPSLDPTPKRTQETPTPPARLRAEHLFPSHTSGLREPEAPLFTTTLPEETETVSPNGDCSHDISAAPPPGERFPKNAVETGQAIGRRQESGKAAGPSGVSRPPRLLGQLNNLYLLFENEAGLLVIDQHAAHERLLFERLKLSVSTGTVERQTLLYPVVVELSAADLENAVKHADTIRRLGLEIEPFGHDSCAIRAVPTLLAHLAPQDLLMQVLQDLSPTDSGKNSVDHLHNTVLAAIACKAAVKAGDRMTDTEILDLVHAVCRNPVFSHCPHGRPTVRQITTKELEKWFHRTV